ncbi:MAG: sugar ABC transporter permease [Actinomycetota bacterium]|nr:sugar ABC transporter permease [Actinomycetota bacterium]
MNYVLGNKKAIGVFLAPALLVYIGVMIVPIVWSLVYAFFKGSPILGFEPNGLANFTKLFTDDVVRSATVFTIQYAIVITIGQIVMGYLFALLYVFILRRSSTVVRTLVFFPVVLPTVAVSLLFSRMFQVAPQVGPINALLGLVGVGPVDWFDSGAHAFVVIVVMDLWRTMGFYAVLLYAGLIEVPEEVIESARLDGASGWKLVRHIVLPMSLPVLLSSLIFSLNSAFKVFDSILALNNGGPGTATTPLNLYMFQTSFIYSDYGYGSTIALLITVLCLSVTLMVFRSSRRDLSKA